MKSAPGGKPRRSAPAVDCDRGNRNLLDIAAPAQDPKIKSNGADHVDAEQLPDIEIPYLISQGIASWRRTVVEIAPDEKVETVFRDAARELLAVAAKQSPEVRQVIVDTLSDIAITRNNYPKH